MAVNTSATQSALYLSNDRPESSPTLKFNEFGLGFGHTTIIWCRMTSNIGAQILTHSTTSGALTYFSSDGYNWALILRDHFGLSQTHYLGPITLNRWTAIAYTMQDGGSHKVYIGEETNPTLPVQLALVLNVTNSFLLGAHSVIHPIGTPNNSICNFKHFNQALTLAQIQIHANTWLADGDQSAGLPVANWASPLRVPGDLSSIAIRSGLGNWTHNYGYDVIQSPENFLFDGNEPGYLANQRCAAWLYPVGTGTLTIANQPYIFVRAVPGSTPNVPTFYDGTVFYRMEDRGALPDVPYVTHAYVARPFLDGSAGTPPSEYWALFTDPNGNRISDTTNPIYRLDDDGVSAIPFTTTIQTIYAWKYGAQFKYAGTPTITTAAHGVVVQLALSISYIGKPTGIRQFPIVDLSGLFIIDETGPRIDQYNGITLKIPDPTIRTAYIGE